MVIATNRQEAQELLAEYFGVQGEAQIQEDGLVNVTGNVFLKPKIVLPHQRLPVQFGHVTGVFHFNYYEKGLATLEGSPHTVGLSFNCVATKVGSLKGCPRTVGRSMEILYCDLENFEGAPDWVGGKFHCEQNPITSFAGLKPHSVGDTLSFTYSSTLPLMPCLLIAPSVKAVQFGEGTIEPVTSILNRHIPAGEQGQLACAVELAEHGLKDNARW